MLMSLHTRRIRGFSLIELMIAVAIVGILAAIAMPSYQNSVRKSKRQVAISDMLLYKQAEEKFRTNNLTYAIAAQLSVAPYAFTISSSSSDYTFLIDDGAGGNPTATFYRIIATARGTQALGAEASCTPLTLTSSDVRGPAASCWAK